MKIKKWTLALSGLALLSSCTTNGPSGDSSFPGSSSEGDFSSSSSEAPSSESAPESFSEASSQSQAEAISDKVYAVLEGMKAGNLFPFLRFKRQGIDGHRDPVLLLYGLSEFRLHPFEDLQRGPVLLRFHPQFRETRNQGPKLQGRLFWTGSA